jgi:hypothetical protein
VQVAERVIAERIGLANCADYTIELDLETMDYYEEEEESPSYPAVRTVYRKTIVEGSLEVTNGRPKAMETLGLKGNIGFSRQEGNDEVQVYKWLNESECNENNVKLTAPSNNVEVSALIHAPIAFEEADLHKYLSENGVDASKFPDMTEFMDELYRGEAELVMMPDQRLVRRVEAVIVEILNDDSETVLVEVSEEVKGQTKILNRLPGLKRRPDENQFMAARRIFDKFLKVSDNCINFEPRSISVVAEEKNSTQFPGLKTQYSKRIIKAHVDPRFIRRRD